MSIATIGRQAASGRMATTKGQAQAVPARKYFECRDYPALSASLPAVEMPTPETSAVRPECTSNDRAPLAVSRNTFSHPAARSWRFGRGRFGDEGYAKEELVAELGSAFLCADLGITPEVRDDHAAYIASPLNSPVDDLAGLIN
jgi:hypothetical protein